MRRLSLQTYVYVGRRRRSPKIDEVQPCSCDPDRGQHCGPGDGCLCRDLQVECDPAHCPAGLKCRNQRMQRMMLQRHPGSDRRLLLVREAGPRKGLGLFAGEIIPRGSLVCVYVGEVINGKEARRRRKLYGKQVANYSCGK